MPTVLIYDDEVDELPEDQMDKYNTITHEHSDEVRQKLTLQAVLPNYNPRPSELEMTGTN